MLPEASARNVSTATNAQKMLAAQMQVLNSPRPLLTQTRGCIHPGHAVTQGVGVLQGVQAAKSQAQSKQQEKDKERVCKLVVQNWEHSRGAEDTAKLGPSS